MNHISLDHDVQAKERIKMVLYCLKWNVHPDKVAGYAEWA